MTRFLTASGLAIVASFSAGAAQALTIVPTFDASIVNSPNAAAIENNINNALQFYDKNFSSPTTVLIDFQISASVGGGQSLTSLYQQSTAQYVSTLAFVAAANPQNLVLQSAAAFAGSGNASIFPTSTLLATSAEMNAIGLSASGFLDANGGFTGNFDGIVTVNSGLNFTDTAGPNGVNATATFQHEIDEVLGIGGSGSFLDDQAQFPNTLGVLDLYRYAAPGKPSFTTATNATSYLSFDGGQTAIAQFNQSGQGDASDWSSFTSACNNGTHLVQDYAECSGGPVISLNRNSPEVTALQGIGFNLALPEPSTWALMLVGFGFIGTTLRRRSLRYHFG